MNARTIILTVLLTLSPALLQARDVQARGARNVAELPSHINVSENTLTLYADYNARQGDAVPLYLINNTNQARKLSTQDGSLYLKLEYQGKDGRWKRAQSHWYGWCGNSYYNTTLPANSFIRIQTYSPAKGEKRRIRFRRYAKDNPLVSNVGEGFINPQIAQQAATDMMAIRFGDFEFVKNIALGNIKVPEKKNRGRQNPRTAAIWTLRQKRFAREDVRPVLESLLNDSDKQVAGAARQLLKELSRAPGQTK